MSQTFCSSAKKRLGTYKKYFSVGIFSMDTLRKKIQLKYLRVVWQLPSNGQVGRYITTDHPVTTILFQFNNDTFLFIRSLAYEAGFKYDKIRCQQFSKSCQKFPHNSSLVLPTHFSRSAEPQRVPWPWVARRSAGKLAAGPKMMINKNCIRICMLLIHVVHKYLSVFVT